VDLFFFHIACNEFSSLNFVESDFLINYLCRFKICFNSITLSSWK